MDKTRSPDIEAAPAESLHGVEDGKSTGSMFAHFEEVKHVKQGLHQRHIQMIALAGTIGTGLFLGSGRAVANAGPLGAWLGYSIIGITVCSVVIAVAEMGALVPLSGSVVRFSEFFVDPALAFANGWNMIYSYIVSIPSEIVATAVLVQFWVEVNNAIWITVFGALIIFSSSLFVRVYGELEFGFGMLKIFLVVFINILALIITCGGGPSGETIGFRYWRNPGPFVQYLDVPGTTGRFIGFWSTFNNALYAYGGIHAIAIAAAETKNPRQAIPQAAKRIFWRVLIFYVITIFMAGLVVPSNDPNLLHSTGTAAQSPFVIAANNARIKVVPSIINAIVLTSAWSSGNSNMLTGSRVLYGMANADQAPKMFLKISRIGIPYYCVGLLSIFIALGYMSLQDTASTVFTWLQDLVAISTLTDWIIVLITYLRFYYGCKSQGIDRKKELPWSAPFQPWFSWFSLVLFLLLLLTSGYTTFMHHHWNTETFVSSYFNIPFTLALYFGHKFWKKTKIIPLQDIPIRGFIDVANANPEPRRPKATGLRRLNVLWS
ncbi:Dicarboxylic amino acid permease [Fulvia fulva]|uniref:Dicarboxylic amino acid permease n=1 Tax=Passalora fulva TaxID=5499 RepID=A0A9Q8PG41_PASFU|nr:Dicarboxylic amino acid permease [Fulvia fulva]KAK4613499.1 Dicarboxylic amino acid permease [Fulvia fulva]KAK4614780.1 Dicarboxylic amino acid permease [Fulvia fulva]UJO21861.1 Dicarboxylic amino acid permease [Fulvia fulva]WPV20322.1 Dicarboxylic amino acid permease [Fulvia fulva]WPV35624.1 Dicarboxylic amino acid permease [Fulvia fulva]